MLDTGANITAIDHDIYVRKFKAKYPRKHKTGSPVAVGDSRVVLLWGQTTTPMSIGNSREALMSCVIIPRLAKDFMAGTVAIHRLGGRLERGEASFRVNAAEPAEYTPPVSLNLFTYYKRKVDPMGSLASITPV